MCWGCQAVCVGVFSTFPSHFSACMRVPHSRSVSLLPLPSAPQVEEQLLVYQQTLKQKSRQLKAMEAELENVKGLVTESKTDVEMLTMLVDKMQRSYVARQTQALAALG